LHFPRTGLLPTISGVQFAFVGATDSPTNRIFHDTGRICRPYR